MENFFLERQQQNPLEELFGYFEKLFARDFNEQITVEESFELIETDLENILGKRLDVVNIEEMQDFREKWSQFFSHRLTQKKTIRRFVVGELTEKEKAMESKKKRICILLRKSV